MPIPYPVPYEDAPSKGKKIFQTVGGAIPVVGGVVSAIGGLFNIGVANPPTRSIGNPDYSLDDDTGPMWWNQNILGNFKSGSYHLDGVDYDAGVQAWLNKRGIGEPNWLGFYIIKERRRQVNAGELPQDSNALTNEDRMQLGESSYRYTIETGSLAIARKHRAGYPNNNPPVDVITGKVMVQGEWHNKGFSDYATLETDIAGVKLKQESNLGQLKLTSAGFGVLATVILVGLTVMLLMGRKKTWHQQPVEIHF